MAAPDAAIPIARRIAASPVFFPLWLRGRPGPHARMVMVGWFDPGQLLSTGLKSLVSLVVGEQSSARHGVQSEDIEQPVVWSGLRRHPHPAAK